MVDGRAYVARRDVMAMLEGIAHELERVADIVPMSANGSSLLKEGRESHISTSSGTLFSVHCSYVWLSSGEVSRAS